MKKLLLMILPAFICAGSLFAQTSTVSGVWERGKTKAVKMFKIVEGGNLSEVATRSEERRVGKECRSRWSPYH